MAGLQGVLANIPGLAGYLAGEQNNQQSQAGQLQQLAGVMGLKQALQAQQAKQQQQAMEQQFRAELGALGPNPSQDQLMGVAAKYAPAKDLLTSQTASLDRKAQREMQDRNLAEQREARAADLQARGEQRLREIEAQAQQQRITREEADRRSAETREYMARLMAQLRPPQQPRQLQLTTDAAGNQLVVNPDGTTRPLTTQDGAGVTKPVGADKPMTEFQGKASLYGTRAAQSDKILKGLEEKISLPGLEAARTLGRTGNYLLSSEQQRVDQAQRDFVNAVLRQESGAVISDAEFDNAKRQYFPQPGDDKKTIEQKRQNRKIAIDGFKRMSGPKGAVDIDAIIGAPLLPTGAPANTASGQIGPKRLKFDANGNPVQ